MTSRPRGAVPRPGGVRWRLVEGLTDVRADVATALAASLDLDAQLAALAHRGARTLPGPGLVTGGVIGRGERVRWSVRVLGVPLRHTSEIIELVERTPDGGARFVDAMVRGAFRGFRHEHDLEPLPGGGTRMWDTMTWTSPLGPLGRLADALLVRRVLGELLGDRNVELSSRLGGPPPSSSPSPSASSSPPPSRPSGGG